MKLQGKVALVTGAASGIGRATVRRRDAEGAAETVEGLASATEVMLDVADSGQVNAAFEQAEQDHGRLDVVVNAAGIGDPDPAVGERTYGTIVRALEAAGRGEELARKWDFIERITDEDFARVVQVNLFGTFYCLRAAVPALTRSGGGSIVNISSVAALVGNPMPVYYPASKAGVLGLTRAAAGELAERNIRVNAVAPGAVDTPLLNAGPQAVVDMLVRLAPLARAARPEEIASTILFLASEESAFYTGQTLSPNGGMHM